MADSRSNHPNQQPSEREQLDWPPLPLDPWADTRSTVHLWTQMLGKVTLALRPFRNHWWNVALRLTPSGLTTGTLPFRDGAFSIDLDFLRGELRFETSDAETLSIPLVSQSTASFFAEFQRTLARVVDVRINPVPAEIPGATPMDRDEQHGAYDAEPARRWHRILLRTEHAFRQHAAWFTGKSSPVLFYWGSFDLSMTQFSGRSAPFLNGAPRFMALAEDRENLAYGFWPGNTSMSGVTLGEPAFYAYVYPEPPGFRDAPVLPAAATYRPELGQFILPYDAVRTTESPGTAIHDFLRTVYEAATSRGAWDRPLLEVDYPETGRVQG